MFAVNVMTAVEPAGIDSPVQVGDASPAAGDVVALAPVIDTVPA